MLSFGAVGRVFRKAAGGDATGVVNSPDKGGVLRLRRVLKRGAQERAARAAARPSPSEASIAPTAP